MKTRQFSPHDYNVITTIMVDAIRDGSIALDVHENHPQPGVTKITLRSRWLGCWIPIKTIYVQQPQPQPTTNKPRSEQISPN